MFTLTISMSSDYQIRVCKVTPFYHFLGGISQEYHSTCLWSVSQTLHSRGTGLVNNQRTVAPDASRLQHAVAVASAVQVEITPHYS